MKYVYKNRIEIFIQFATRVWDIDPDFDNLELVALEGIERLKCFFKRIGLPTSLRELDIPDDRLEEMALRCTEGGTSKIGNFVKLGKEDVLNILKNAK